MLEVHEAVGVSLTADWATVDGESTVGWTLMHILGGKSFLSE